MITVFMKQRRQFLSKLCLTIAPAIFLPARLRAQADDQKTRPRNRPDSKSGEDDNPLPAASRKAALEENEKDIKTKVEKLFQLASELKEEVEKTDSAKVLSLAMLKKAEEIEKLAKDIKTRAKG
jgi:hypothetical protein